MSKLSNAVNELSKIENQAGKDKWLNQIHPLVKLFITIFYMSMVVSFDKYNLTGLFGMALYPLIVFIIGDIQFSECIHRVKLILPIVCIIGIFNPLFDKEVLMQIGEFAVTGGMISMISLIIKGILTVLAAYLLIITTSIEKVCYAMRKIHIPKTLVTVILLTYRYITVLLKEAERITQAYSLRAPNQKGIHRLVWGSLIGQLLLRSMDRAIDIYESMNLRGYGMQNSYYINEANQRFKVLDITWVLLWTLIIFGLRKVPIFLVVGNIFV